MYVAIERGNSMGKVLHVGGRKATGVYCRFLEMRVKMPVNVIRIEAPQQAECFRFNIQV